MQTIIDLPTLREDEADPRQLRVNVTSLGGTTEAALKVLGRHGRVADHASRHAVAAARR